MTAPSPPVAASSKAPASTLELTVALAGNPNVGKTTLFNAITGLKQKVANYPGVTVEKKVGKCDLGAGAPPCSIIDLPGTYSLASRSPDEHVARQVLLGQIQGTPRPSVIVVVADGSNLERNLYLVTQVLELGRPVVVALSMVDIAMEQGKTIDVEKLSRHLRAPVVPVQAHKNKGIDLLKAEIAKAARVHASESLALDLPLPELLETHVDRLKKILADEKLSTPDQANFDAHLILTMGDEELEAGDLPDERRKHPKVREVITAALADCEKAEIDPISAEVETHYAFIGTVVADCVREDATRTARQSRTDKLDRILTHKVWGMATFIAIMGLVFWSIFSWAGPLMDFLSDTVINKGVGGFVANHMSEGPLKSLIIDGIIAGVGNVIVFVPQIVILFTFLALLEDSGYMSRAAFLMDRLMSKVGLHGKSFIPLLSGYACAIPAIMGTRVIENRRDRLATILILPLMSCSARLPVYALIIGTFFGSYAGWQRAAIMLAMYALGTLSAFALAFLFKRTLLKGPAPAFILEMPPYRLPKLRVVITTVAQRAWAFLKRAGTVIFAMSVLMWAATHYPKPAAYSQNYDEQIRTMEREIEPIQKRHDTLHSRLNPDHITMIPEILSNAELKAQAEKELAALDEQIENQKSKIENLQNAQSHEVLENSIAGRVGRFIAPVFAPLGYDWKLSIGVTGAFFAREVVVSTLGIVYSVGEADETSESLRQSIRADYSPLVGISLMVFVVFCMQCLPTLAVAKKETGHWGWPAFMFVYMTGLAWLAAFATYQLGSLLHLGTK